MAKTAAERNAARRAALNPGEEKPKRPRKAKAPIATSAPSEITFEDWLKPILEKYGKRKMYGASAHAIRAELYSHASQLPE
jgi:hypothetical protein